MGTAACLMALSAVALTLMRGYIKAVETALCYVKTGNRMTP